MSTICKLSPEVRRQRELRAAVLRNPIPAPKDPKKRGEYIAVMTELSLIAKSSRLRGSTKHTLFMRGINQLAKL